MTATSRPEFRKSIRGFVLADRPGIDTLRTQAADSATVKAWLHHELQSFFCACEAICHVGQHAADVETTQGSSAGISAVDASMAVSTGAAQ